MMIHSDKFSRADQRRFWSKVSRRVPNKCWLWRAARSTKGYGKFAIRCDGRLRATYAHRVAWELSNGPVPDGLCICHTCDTPACVNPAHMFLGTHADNVADKIAKGRLRTPSGEKHPHAKLTWRDVREARQLHMQGWTFRKLAERYGVTRWSIQSAFNGRTWKDAGMSEEQHTTV